MQFDPTAFLADPELVEALAKRATTVQFETDCVLFRQGEPSVGLYIVLAGTVALTMCAANSVILQVETGPGSLLGVPAVIGNQPYSLTAEARPGSDVRFISREEFTTLMRSNPDLAFKILQVLANEVRSARFALS